MSEWVGLDVVDGVGPVAVKRRRPSEDDALLDHEASVLSSIDHPGVVRLVERRTEPVSALVTHFVATHSLATAPPPGLDDAIGMVVALAHTVAHLHGLGIRHGAIDPSHVLVGPGKRPVLCGFSGATGPGDDPGEDPTTADDVAAVGRLMQQLIAGHDGLEPIPVHRPRRGVTWSGYRQRALLMLADHCQADDPASRPSATSLAATIDDLTATGTGPGRRGAERRAVDLMAVVRRTRAAASTHTRPAAAALVAIGVLAGGMAWNSLHGSSRHAAAERAAAVSPPITSATPILTTTTMMPTTTMSPRGDGPCSDAGATSGADTDGDGCADARAVVHGQTITVGDVDYSLGRPGDRILIGDWSCDGLVTAVLVRSDPAAIWHFPDWALEGETTTASPIAGDIDPASVTRRRNAEGCHVLLARRPGERTPRPLEVRP